MDYSDDTIEEILSTIRESFNIYLDSLPQRTNEVGVYHPGVLPNCLRLQYLDFVEPINPTRQDRGVFARGNDVQDRVVKILENNPRIEVVAVEQVTNVTHATKDISILEHPDIIIKVSIRVGKKIIPLIVEVKSVDTQVLWHIRRTMEPFEYNIQQTMAYMKGTGIHNGVLLYVSCSNYNEHEIFWIKYDSELFTWLLNRAVELDQYVRSRTLPPPECKLDPKRSKEYNNCRRKERCDEIENEKE